MSTTLNIQWRILDLSPKSDAEERRRKIRENCRGENILFHIRTEQKTSANSKRNCPRRQCTCIYSITVVFGYRRHTRYTHSRLGNSISKIPYYSCCATFWETILLHGRRIQRRVYLFPIDSIHIRTAAFESSPFNCFFSFQHAQDLPLRDYSFPCDPMIRVSLHRDRRSLRRRSRLVLAEFQTEVVRHESNPKYNRTFQAEVPMADYKVRVHY